jgi:hypothetical protein
MACKVCNIYDDILADLLLGIRRFANDIRWKEYWMIKKATEKAEEDKNILPNSPSNQLFQQFGFDAENKKPNIIEDDTPNKNVVAPTIVITPDHKGFGNPGPLKGPINWNPSSRIWKPH